MEITRKRAKTFAAAAMVGYASLLFQQVDASKLSFPAESVLDADVANTAGTATTKGTGGYYATPPDAPIEVRANATRGAADF